MREKNIRKLIKIVEDSNIAELEVSRWGQKVRISKYSSNPNNALNAASQKQNGAQQIELDEVAGQSESPIPTAPVSSVASDQANGQVIRSPMVGTFYSASAPGTEPYVEIGDHISPGKVLCIIEAMKLMNEIEAEISGTVLEILVENGNPVEYNQPLFKITAK